MKIAKVKSRTPLRLPIDGGYTLVNEAASSSRVSLEYSEDCGGCLKLYVDGRVSQSIPWHNINEFQEESTLEPLPLLPKKPPPPPVTVPDVRKARR